MLIRIDTIFYTTTTQNQGVTDVSYNSGILSVFHNSANSKSGECSFLLRI